MKITAILTINCNNQNTADLAFRKPETKGLENTSRVFYVIRSVERQRGGKLTINFTVNMFFVSVKIQCYSNLLRNVGGSIRRHKASHHKHKTDNNLTVTKITIFPNFE
jgi:hypothetical protein